jgi:hypothetical protein
MPLRHSIKRGRRCCGAQTRKGTPCMAPALTNGRCRMHGGLSTGPTSIEGRRRIAEAARKRRNKSE